MASKTDLCNMAISIVAQGKLVTNVDTENSQEAIACRLFYEDALEATLKDAPWPFATLKHQALTLVEESPNDAWGYSYRYPTNCVSIQKIWSGQRVDTRDSKIPYEIGADDAGRLIYCDVEDAIANYTKRVTNTALHTANFNLAFAHYLAFLISPRMIKGNSPAIRDRILRDYQFEISRAIAVSLNEEKRDKEPESDLIRARY